MRTPKKRAEPTSCHRTIYARNSLWDALDERAAAANLSRSEFAERILLRYLRIVPREHDHSLVSE